MSVENINDSNYEASVKSNKFVVMEFGAAWCGPCRMMYPILVELSEQKTDTKFFKIDIDESPDSASKMNVRAVPTMILYKDGVEVKREVGAISKFRLAQLLNDNLI